jgi:hypothetical protein
VTVAVYVYAICRAQASAPAVAGLGGQPLRVVRSGRLGALVGDCPSVPGPRDEDELWRHESAVEALMERSDVLPARFGTLMESDAAVRALLERRACEFDEALGRVAGAHELSVRVMPQEDGQRAPGGTGYLAARADHHRRAETLGRMLEQRLRPFSRGCHVRIPALSGTPVAGAFLVEREMTAPFLAEAELLEAELEPAALTLTGPWPPYSFVNADGQEL